MSVGRGGPEAPAVISFTGMADTFEERARRRRQTWRSGRARGFEEAQAHDEEFWQAASGADRLAAVWQLALDALVIHPPQANSDAAEPGFPRLPFGTRRRRG